MGGHALGERVQEYVRLATGLAGGLAGSKQEMCGALAGGVMVIGALYGRDTWEDDDQKAYALSGRYKEWFLAEFGSTQCQPIYDEMHPPDGSGSCSEVGERAARILMEVLDEV